MHNSSGHTGGSHEFSAHPRQQRELERLERQALVAWAEEQRLLTRLGLADGMRVLDVGCGAGFVTAQIAELNPNGETIGLEPDLTLAKLASDRFNGRAGLSLHVGSIDDNHLAEGSFDFAYARFVFQHVLTPIDDLRALRHLLRSGGKLVLTDADDALTVLYPEPPELDQIMQLLAACQARRGGDRHVGRKLPDLLRAAGFSDVAFHVVPFTNHMLGRRALLDLAVSSRLARLDERAAAEAAPLVERMHAFFAEHDWHGMACIIAAVGVRA